MKHIVTGAPRSLLAILFGVVCLCQLGSAQGERPDDAKRILSMSEADQIRFVQSVLDQNFPEAQSDRFALLLVNRSDLVIPVVRERIEAELRNAIPPERFIELASAMISYAGDEHALRAVSQLVQIDEVRFGLFVTRTLDAAIKWGNAFPLVYRALEAPDDRITRRATQWTSDALKSNRMRRAWAESMLDRYGRVPTDAEWSADPIASRQMDAAPQELRQSVLRFAAEAQDRRRR